MDERCAVAERWKRLSEAIQFFAQCPEIAAPLDFNCLGFEGADDFSIEATPLFFRLALDHFVNFIRYSLDGNVQGTIVEPHFPFCKFWGPEPPSHPCLSHSEETGGSSSHAPRPQMLRPVALL